MTRRPFLSAVLIFAALIMAAPTTALGQHTRLIFGSDHGIYVPAADHQLLRVTIGNPAPSDANGSSGTFVLTFNGEVNSVAIAPGASFTFTIDPREVGQLVDARTGLRHVRVAFHSEIEVEKGSRAPQPAITIENVNRRSGAVQSFLAFPGFVGGVRVAD